MNEVESLATCPHGDFGNWLKVNCRVKERQAQKYMKLVVDMPELLNSNPYRGADLSIKAALELLSSPDEVKQEVQAKIDSGEAVVLKGGITPFSKAHGDDRKKQERNS